MSDAENHHHGKNEIVVIKRHGGGDHDGHHGGAWKIAYADFMTAMMAFFLLMWLVNAANQATKASVASYFNPIKLADERPTQKGVKKPADQAQGEEQKERSKIKADDTTVGKAAATGSDMTSTSGDKPLYSEGDLFQNPYAVLAEIAQEVGQQANISAKGDGGASNSGPATGASGGQAYRDPFSPDFWSEQMQTQKGTPGQPQTASQTVTGQNQTPQADGKTDPFAKQANTPDANAAPNPSQQQQQQSAQMADAKPAEAQPKDQSSTGAQSVAMVIPKPRPDSKAADTAQNPDAAAATPTPQAIAAAGDLKKEIAKEISGVAGKLADGLIVTPAEGGTLITLTDQSKAPMFNVGSAVPEKAMVLAMAKIGKILSERKGQIVIRGYTDARQFKGTTNDNWGLSMDRARAAYYMLLRGGLDASRISQMTGFADRRPLIPNDPMADANRRIEILIQGAQ
ncbi:MotB family protein [Allorhizobium sp. BGMRC 0089]|uniref:MotB family protein n=1 Tax=Allorhizobium sonneratiae TaxID=2934936 RepID=UPI0020339F2D|nr:MotB family protein [Allorhizobium sonneratiae]MCM2291375.1 MotB family protein [Allorhizobium sonneratiae]